MLPQALPSTQEFPEQVETPVEVLHEDDIGEMEFTEENDDGAERSSSGAEGKEFSNDKDLAQELNFDDEEEEQNFESDNAEQEEDEAEFDENALNFDDVNLEQDEQELEEEEEEAEMTDEEEADEDIARAMNTDEDLARADFEEDGETENENKLEGDSFSDDEALENHIMKLKEEDKNFEATPEYTIDEE